MFITPAYELMQDEGDFVGMRCAPGNNALELKRVVSDGTDFQQFGFDDLRVSHTNSSMAHVGAWKGVRWRIPASMEGAAALTRGRVRTSPRCGCPWSRPVVAAPAFRLGAISD